MKHRLLLCWLILIWYLPANASLRSDSVMAGFDSVTAPNERLKAICRYAQQQIGTDPEFATELVKEAIASANEKHAQEGIRFCYMTLGGIAYFQGDYDKAIAHFYQAMDVYDGEDMQLDNARVLGNIGVIYKKQNQLEKAYDAQQQALGIFEGVSDSMGISITLTNMGEIHRLRKEYERALEHYQRSAAIKQAISHTAGLGIVYNNMGLCYSEKGDFTEANRYLQMALDIEMQLGNDVRITETLLDLANHYHLSGQYQKSIQMANEALPKAKLLGLKENVSSLYLLLSRNYAALHQHEKAYQMHEAYSTLKDSILNEDVNRKIAEMDAKYQTSRKERELERKRFELQQKESELQQHRLERNLVILGLLSAIVAIGFLIRSTRQNQKIAALVKSQNLLIQKKNSDLQKINEKVQTELEKLQVAVEDKEKMLSNIFEEKRLVDLPAELLSLSTREMEVLSYLALGWSDQEISDKLFVSKATTKTHLRRIYSKLLVKGRAEAVSIAHQHGILGG